MAFITKARLKLRLPMLHPICLFAFVWISGLSLGTVFAAVASNHYFLMMHRAPSCPVTIVGLAATVLLPFLFTAFAVYKNRHWMLFVICFTKAFIFAHSGFGIHAAYGSAGWLIRPLFQFSDLLTVPVLCWYSLQNLTKTASWRKREFWICLGIDILVCCLDLWYISPFLAMITKN